MPYRTAATAYPNTLLGGNINFSILANAIFVCIDIDTTAENFYGSPDIELFPSSTYDRRVTARLSLEDD